MAVDLAGADRFLLANARLVDRLLYERVFLGGSTDSVVAAIRAYRNADGGLGHALEPDLRTAASQPIYVQAGLEIMVEADARDEDLISGNLGFLARIARADGAIPYALPSAMDNPRAEHWNGDYALQPSLHATAGLCGKFFALGARNEWLDRAVDYCVADIATRSSYTPHTLLNVLELLRWMPDRRRADALWPIASVHLSNAEVVALEIPSTTYGLSPLRFAPSPDHPARPVFDGDLIERHLDYLAEQQRTDGGWPITWDPPSPAAVLEWRGRWTVGALITLRAYGRV